MFELTFSNIITLSILCFGLYFLTSVFIKKLRLNWSFTTITTGAISNIGLGLFITYGALVILFVPLPFGNFFTAIIFGVVPMVISWLIAFKGYKIDMQNHKDQK